MTDLEAGGAAKPKRASKPRQKKAVSGSAVTPTTADAASRTAPFTTPRAATTRSAPPQGAASRPPAAKSSSPRAAARPARFRAAGPGLNDWLSFALLLLLIVGAVFLYQWRGEAAKLPAASQTTTQQAAPPRR